MIGEASQVLVRNPFELIKQNMQLGKYSTVLEAGRDILKNFGVQGFYRGYLVTVLREIPFGLIQYPLYEITKRKVKKDKDLKIIDYCRCGAIAGGISAFLTNPLDVIKTRIMTSGEKKYDFKKFIPTFKNICENEGTSKLFSGVHVRVLYISVGGMIFFGTNEFLKNIFYFNHNF